MPVLQVELVVSSVRLLRLEGTSRVMNIVAVPVVKVSVDGHGVVWYAGMGILRGLADRTGLSAQVTVVLADTYRGPWVRPGGVRGSGRRGR